jgi:hypothetical protein
MSYEIFGAAALIFGGFILGRGMNEAEDKKASRLESLLALMRFFRVQIDCYCTPVGEIFKRCDKSILSSCGCGIEPRSFYEFSQSLSPPPDREISALLESFAAELGASYREEQLKSCDYHIAKLSGICERERGETVKRKKLNMTVCLCASAAVAVFLL